MQWAINDGKFSTSLRISLLALVNDNRLVNDCRMFCGEFGYTPQICLVQKHLDKCCEFIKETTNIRSTVTIENGEYSGQEYCFFEFDWSRGDKDWRREEKYWQTRKLNLEESIAVSGIENF